MASPLDVLIATTLARATRTFRTSAHGAAAGLEFERALYDSVLRAHDWRYATPPDQFDLGLQIATRTGIRYEHDGMVATGETLYTLEAKWLAGPVTREIVGIVVMKLLDTLIGSYADMGHFAIKPVIIAGNGGADAAAFQYAAAFGILLITPERPTPFEMLHIIQSQQPSTPVARRFQHECEALADELWRPFGDILPSRQHALSLTLAAERIYDANRTAQLLEHWDECRQTARDLRLLEPASLSSSRRNRRSSDASNQDC